MELRDKFSPEKLALATYAERKEPTPSFWSLIRDFLWLHFCAWFWEDKRIPALDPHNILDFALCGCSNHDNGTTTHAV